MVPFSCTFFCMVASFAATFAATKVKALHIGGQITMAVCEGITRFSGKGSLSATYEGM
jgi:hypothetical protein